ncbi:MAG: hypothetical protein KatS3mg076_0139 [Candidatus Binatia bacterium]|nr:MAG: hypothetical protein KatS3mg076_0139 [Candidatus Binatia bacterium]
MLTRKAFLARLGLVAGLLVLAGGAGATTTPDRAAAILVYPKIVVDSELGIDTIVQISNEAAQPADLHCFYVNANSHCTTTGLPCRTGSECGPFGACVPGWSELDFSVRLTADQPLYWLASQGRNRGCAQSGDCEPLPLGGGFGVCSGAPIQCTSDSFCQAFSAGTCLNVGAGNAGTSVPPVPEDPFIGELKCILVNPDGTPRAANWVAGQATIVRDASDPDVNVDAQSYAAIGIRAYFQCEGGDNHGMACSSAAQCPDGNCVSPQNGDDILVLGGPDSQREYESCPSVLIANHLFDGAPEPINGQPVVTDLTLVPCSQDFLLGSANQGFSTAQFLVFNEFEQRFSTSLPVRCFEETLLSNIDTRNNERSIFSVNVAGTVAGQSRIRGVGSGLLGVARLQLAGFPPQNPTLPWQGPGAGYNLHEEGQRNDAGQEDIVALP